MPRSFEMSFSSPASVEQVYSAFGSPEYWQARVETLGRGIGLDSLTVDADGTINVTTTQDLRHDGLPGIIAAVYRRDLHVVSNETWRPASDGTVHGDIRVAAVGAPGSGGGSTLLSSSGSGSVLELSATVEFKVPLVGGKIERVIADQFVAGLGEIQRFTTDWIAERA